MKSEQRSLFISDNETLNLTFLVLSGTSILCVASAIDPLRAANRIAGETLYSWDIVSPDGANPQTTSGLPVAVSGKFDSDANHEVLIVIAGFGTAPYTKGPFLAGLRKAGRRLPIADYPSGLLHCGGPVILRSLDRLAAVRREMEARP